MVEALAQNEETRDRARVRWLFAAVVATGCTGNIFLAHTQYGFHSSHPRYPQGWAIGGFSTPHAVYQAGQVVAVRPLLMAAEWGLLLLSSYGAAVAGDWVFRTNRRLFRSFNVMLFLSSMVLGGTVAAIVNERSAARMLLLWFAIIGQLAPCLAVAGLAGLVAQKLPARRRDSSPAD